MRLKLVFLFLTLLLPQAVVVAQQPIPTAPPLQAAIALGAIRWYADFDSASAERPLVVSRKTIGVGPRPSRTEGDRQSHILPLAAADIEALRHGRGVATVCDTVDLANRELCGIRTPWVWLVLSNAQVEGDEAEVVLEARRSGDSPAVGHTSLRFTDTYRLHLVRREGGWQVVSYELVAVG